MADKKQLDIAERLQVLLLEDFETRIKSDEGLTPTDRATLARLLTQNGWSLDPAQVPQGLRDKLSTRTKASDLNDDDADVLPMRRQG